MTMITPSYLGETIEYSSLHACRSTLEDPTVHVQDVVTAATEDASYLYFVATGTLSSAENRRGEVAIPGADNLYMLHYDSTSSVESWEQPKFIAVLSSEDNTDWAGITGPEENAELGSITAQASKSGRYLTFMSDRSLTGYDTLDANYGKPDQEVYLYDATTGSVVCVSCDPTNARPVGIEGKNEAGLVDKIIGDTFLDRGFAANLPGWTPFGKHHEAAYQSRYLTNSGVVFFNSLDALAPQDTNGNEDVYEYEPAGVGAMGLECSESSVTFSVKANGCVALISSGKASGESAFLDASEGGQDVFFLTTGKLVGNDVGSAYDVYDAHICSVHESCVVQSAVPPPCETANSCREAPGVQPSIFGPPASATFVGPGNADLSIPGVAKTSRAAPRGRKLAAALRSCKTRNRHRARRRAGCERRARRDYGGKLSGGAVIKKNGGKR